jgi:hypothetical protein
VFLPTILLLSRSDGVAADSGRPNARCVGVRERGGSDGVCIATGAGGRLSRRRLLRRSDPRPMDLPKEGVDSETLELIALGLIAKALDAA